MRKYKAALFIAAKAAYQDEVIDTDMEDSTVGEGGDFETKEEWIQARVDEWLEEAELSA